LVVRPPRSTTIIWARFFLDTPFRNDSAMSCVFINVFGPGIASSNSDKTFDWLSNCRAKSARRENHCSVRLMGREIPSKPPPLS
jgi:hypothetical protein